MQARARPAEKETSDDTVTRSLQSRKRAVTVPLALLFLLQWGWLTSLLTVRRRGATCAAAHPRALCTRPFHPWCATIPAHPQQLAVAPPSCSRVTCMSPRRRVSRVAATSQMAVTATLYLVIDRDESRSMRRHRSYYLTVHSCTSHAILRGGPSAGSWAGTPTRESSRVSPRTPFTGPLTWHHAYAYASLTLYGCDR